MSDVVQNKPSLWKRWKGISEKVGNFQGRVILEALYFTIFIIPGIIITLFSDKLRIKNAPKTWDERQKQSIENLEEAMEQ